MLGSVQACSILGKRVHEQSTRGGAGRRFAMKTVWVVVLAAALPGCTLLAVADAAGSAVVYGVKTTVNVIDAITPDIVNKKKD